MAARFHFRLEPLRKVREAAEEEAARALARALAREQEVRSQLAELEAAQQAAFASQRREPGEALDLELRRAAGRFLQVLERQQREAYEQLRVASAMVAATREELALAHRNHLMLVRLKERRAAAHAHEVQLREIQEMDELAILRHPRHRP